MLPEIKIWTVAIEDSEILAACEAWKDEWRAWRVRFDAAKEAIGREFMMVYPKRGDMPVSVAGPVKYGKRDSVTGTRPELPVLVGWASYQKYDWLVPARGPTGADARELITSIQPPPDLIRGVMVNYGLPLDIVDPPHWWQWGFRFLTDETGKERPFLTISAAATIGDGQILTISAAATIGDGQIPDRFRPVKQSTFWRLVEENEEREKAAAG